MKKKWENPKLLEIGIESTNEDWAINPDYSRPVRCTICNSRFNNMKDYEAHKREDFHGGDLLGTECPYGVFGDGKLSAEVIILMS